TIQTLQERTSATQQDSKREQPVELITSREAERQIVEQMERSTEYEFVVLTRAPVRISHFNGHNQPLQNEVMKREVRYRAIVDMEFMNSPGVATKTQKDIKLGEEVRVLPKLPLKMIPSDRKLAIIPLNLQSSD